MVVLAALLLPNESGKEREDSPSTLIPATYAGTWMEFVASGFGLAYLYYGGHMRLN